MIFHSDLISPKFFIKENSLYNPFIVAEKLNFRFNESHKVGPWNCLFVSGVFNDKDFFEISEIRKNLLWPACVIELTEEKPQEDTWIKFSLNEPLERLNQRLKDL